MAIPTLQNAVRSQLAWLHLRQKVKYDWTLSFLWMRQH